MTQEMRNKVIVENGRTSMVVTGCYKNQKMCDRAVDVVLMH